MNNQQFKQWCELYAQRSLAFNKPLIMGILNITADSFSDGGLYLQKEDALRQARTMVSEGADLIDVGGESSRPGAVAISLDEELARVIPVIEALRSETDVCISIDTSKAQVMKEAVSAGAFLINDISALSGENALETAASLNVPVCLMHMQGQPSTMQLNPYYKQDVLHELNDFFEHKISSCLMAGICPRNLILDPGFGFGKLPEHNLRIVNNLGEFHKHRLPLLLGASRKSTLGVILGKEVHERLPGGLSIAIVAALHGVGILRTHDVAATHQSLTMLEAIVNESFNHRNSEKINKD
ncbi:dihydropteroate synthase [Legionella jordanis]|uniref:Dihydropteroate synthase n=1 Tax=Legionella jordanis TaxID=456 RepID=A0A0W0VEQ5_9GAMM|nr:dihydropteroate synthase [Legionella jordanis]KTD18121.1 7,8-dihydropteroate synthase [Legionella jordanis]RMX00569.1 dihydropteroate synthase [Legionella jordanis]RMX21314.1 dihydropteroate synthase [Legionella jordanis]VEH13786.1 dihydropteroate synthase [Legionella jordanis]HAT8714169.1 dihydropteroate synthase [Legionella jordanis]